MTTKTKTMTQAQKDAKETRLLKRRANREAHEANVLELQKNEELWATFQKLRDDITSMDGNKLAAVRTLKRLLSVSAKTVNREKLERQREALNLRIARIQAQLDA